ncbi:MAG: hypothetical protein QW782_09275 [Candidatus Bathyarchaeia archaeon]
MQRGKGKPFLEVFALALNEDYRLPILEVFAFLLILTPFIFVSPGAYLTVEISGGNVTYKLVSGARITYSLVFSTLGPSLPIFAILVFKNLAYGLGSDIEKGIIQTYLSYPLKRHMILSAKLLSSIILPLIILLSTQIPALYLLAPEIISQCIDTVLLTYIAGLSPMLLISGIILLVTLLLRRGGLALVSGITLYFVFSTASSMLMFMALAIKSPIILKLLSTFYPSTTLSLYYGIEAYLASEVWTPTFLEVVGYIGVSYLFTAFIFAIAYIYFCRRFSL